MLDVHKILGKHQIIYCYRYADDILIIFNLEYSNIHNTLHEFNTVHSILKFTLETEAQNKINSLTITINKQQENPQPETPLYITTSATRTNMKDLLLTI
jgi:hypothetical protein